MYEYVCVLVRVAEEWYESEGSNPSCQRGLEIAKDNRQQLETEQVLSPPNCHFVKLLERESFYSKSQFKKNVVDQRLCFSASGIFSVFV